MSALLSIVDMNAFYAEKKALSHVSMTVEPGDWMMLIGPNGAGKTTLVRAVTGELRFTGSIRIDGRDVRDMKPKELARHVGVLMQGSGSGYPFTVEEIVSLGRYAYRSGPLHAGRVGDAEAVRKSMEETGLTNLAGRSVHTLSGGELQRVFLAQVLAQDPDILILDEPANHLDLIYQKQLFELLEGWIREKENRAILTVMHDLSLARRFGTKALLLREGKPVCSGTPDEVCEDRVLLDAYRMDVGAWMRELSRSWENPGSGDPKEQGFPADRTAGTEQDSHSAQNS